MTLRATLVDGAVSQSRVVDWFARRDQSVEFHPEDKMSDLAPDTQRTRLESSPSDQLADLLAAWKDVSLIAATLGLDVGGSDGDKE